MSIFFLEITRQNILGNHAYGSFPSSLLPPPSLGIPPYGLVSLENGEFNGKYENWSKKI